MFDSNIDIKLRRFYSYENKYIFITKLPLTNPILEEKELLVRDSVIINQVFDRGLFIGYSFDFKNKDVTYSKNFLNLVNNKNIDPEENSSVILKNKDLLILEKDFSKNLLIIGNPICPRLKF